jgi:SPP1 family predicted phage head-tail adaptor
VNEPSPNISLLTERVQLRRRITSTEDEGGHGASYLPISTVWARVRGLATRQELAADARASTATHVVTMRFRTDLKPGDRVVHRGTTLTITGTSDLNGRRRWLACQCTSEMITG